MLTHVYFRKYRCNCLLDLSGKDDKSSLGMLGECSLKFLGCCEELEPGETLAYNWPLGHYIPCMSFNLNLIFLEYQISSTDHSSSAESYWSPWKPLYFSDLFSHVHSGLFPVTV